MEISRSTSYPMDANAPIAAPTASRSETSTVAMDASTPPAKDRVTISQAAQDKLQAEKSGTAGASPSGTAAQSSAKSASNATSEANQAHAPSDAKKLAYGALGLERPTNSTEESPPDGYTYGRWIAAAVTAAAIISIVA